MEIREASKDEIYDIGKLMLNEFSKEPFNEDVDLESVVKSLDFYFSIGNVFVCYSEEELVGVVVFKVEQWWEGSVVLIEDLAVREDFQKQGIGGSLIDKVEDHAKEIGSVMVGFSTKRSSGSVDLGSKKGYEIEEDRVFIKKHLD